MRIIEGTNLNIELLTSSVESVYLNEDSPISNKELYDKVAKEMGINQEEYVQPVGIKGTLRNFFHTKVRWVQQSLKSKRILTRPTRGHWEMTGSKKIELRSIKEGKKVVALSTSLGICLWAKSESVFNSDMIDEPVHLIITSPPYPLKVSRAYGNVNVKEYIDFIIRVIGPITEKLAEGGSLALNVSNDIFEEKSPARSTYLERLVIAIEDRLNLGKMDSIPWVSNKPPGPIQYASKQRMQLNTTWEPILWFCKNPVKCFANNQRILLPHSEEHMKFMMSGGNKKASVNGDGAYHKMKGAYGRVTEGKIQKNLFEISNYCESGRMVSRYAKMLGISAHGAKMPKELASRLIRFMTEPNQLVVDPFGGTMTSAEAAEENGRRWISTEMMWEYIRSSFIRFTKFRDVWVNPEFSNCFN